MISTTSDNQTQVEEMLAREKEKYIIGYLQARRCWQGRRRSTLLDIGDARSTLLDNQNQGDAGTGEGERVGIRVAPCFFARVSPGCVDILV